MNVLRLCLAAMLSAAFSVYFPSNTEWTIIRPLPTHTHTADHNIGQTWPGPEKVGKQKPWLLKYNYEDRLHTSFELTGKTEHFRLCWKKVSVQLAKEQNLWTPVLCVERSFLQLQESIAGSLETETSHPITPLLLSSAESDVTQEVMS